MLGNLGNMPEFYLSKKDCDYLTGRTPGQFSNPDQPKRSTLDLHRKQRSGTVEDKTKNPHCT
jgi:hypothetical protein